MLTIQKYYIDEAADAGGGGGGGNTPAPPKGYVPTTPDQRSQWNGFLDYAGKQNADLTDPKAQAALLTQYKKANPAFSITSEQIPGIQYEAYQIRKGDKFGNLGAKELGYIRQGLSPNFINADTTNVGKLYYPQMSSHGTDLEGYYNSKFNPSAAQPAVQAPVVPQNTAAPQVATSSPTNPAAAPATAIPLPNYNDPTSRLNYANAFRQKYGREVLRGYGDIPLRVNEKPEFASDTSKNLAIKEGQKLGLDPALLYASSMIEGQSGLYPQKDKKTGEMTVNYTGDDEYPVSGLWSFGLDSFLDYLPQLKKKGYLPKDFEKNYKIWDKPGGPSGKDANEESVMFKTTDAGIQAKAAMLRAFNDEFDEKLHEKNITLSPQQRDFFRLAYFNSGQHSFQLLDAYKKNGLLKNDDFINKIPEVAIPEFIKLYKGDTKKAEALHKQIYGNIVPRLAAAKGLKQEGFF